MTEKFSTACKGCGLELTAATEDELVTRVLEHLAEAHPGHTPSREQVRQVILSRERKHDEGHHFLAPES